jgi:hypothetical protein
MAEFEACLNVSRCSILWRNDLGNGDDRDRTGNLLVANQALSQLSYVPKYSMKFRALAKSGCPLFRDFVISLLVLAFQTRLTRYGQHVPTSTRNPPTSGRSAERGFYSIVLVTHANHRHLAFSCQHRTASQIPDHS